MDVAKNYESVNPILLAVVASVFTWGGTALGAASVFVIKKVSRKFLDCSLGFAAGIMIAAAFWNLLIPAIDASKLTVEHEQFAFISVTIGLVLGITFVYITDKCLPDNLISIPSKSDITENTEAANFHNKESIRRIGLFVVVLMARNIPEGLAGGVAFGSIGQVPNATIGSAFKLAIAIALHNLPEGLAVSLPLIGFGYPKWKAFFVGQFSGMIEPIATIPAALGVMMLKPILPYAYSFVAGAMIYVVQGVQKVRADLKIQHLG